MGSVEGSFIGLSRYIKTHWGDLSWFPLWHLGMPFVNTYPPLTAYTTAAAAAISGFTIPHAFHWTTAMFYGLGPVALFALALRLTKSPWTAFAAGAIYSLISWSAWLIPGIGADLGSAAYPRRLQALVQYGESPHIVSMTLLPIAVLLWDVALDRRRPLFAMLAAIGAAATVLTSWLGGFALALMIAALLLSRGPDLRDLKWTAAIAIVAYCIAMPWAPPSAIAATQFNSKTLGGDFQKTYFAFPVWIAAAAIALAGAKFVIKRLDRAAQFAIFFVVLIASIVFAWTLFGVAVVPQPIRYHLELEMALSLFVAIAITARPRWTPVAIAAMCIALIYPAVQSRRFARNLIRPIDITRTTEYRIAEWLNRECTGERVMMSGSVAFWLTAFSDVPELNGGTEQGSIDFMARVAAYGIYFGASGEAAVLWLKALGVQMVGVSDRDSGEFYKAYRNPRQFEGLLQPVYHDSGDTIYRVGNAPLARIVPRAALVSRTPKHGLDVDPLRAYVAALDDPRAPRAEFEWTSLHSARITAAPQSDQVTSVQIPWHRGWRANAPIHKDALGLMYFDPGPASIEMIYDGGIEMRIARALSATVLIAGMILSVWKR